MRKVISFFMKSDQNLTKINISSSDRDRFRRIVIDVISEACAMPDGEDEYGGIGTLGEKQMHAALKRFICPDVSCHEIKIDGSAGCVARESEGGKRAKSRRFVADILNGNTVYEIQTGSFAPLKSKIQWILDNTTYNIALIHPIAETTWVSVIDGKTGNIGKRKKSPLHERLIDITPELYFLTDFIPSPRFSLIIFVVEAEQYKKNIQKDPNKRPRYKKYERIPLSLLSAAFFRDLEDYKIFIPDDLPERFTVKQYSLKAGIYGIDAYSAVKNLCAIGLLEPDGNIGRAAAYKRRYQTPRDDTCR